MSIEFFEGFETCGTETGIANQATTRPRVVLRWDGSASGGIPASDSFYLIDDQFTEGYALKMTENSFGSGNYLQWNVPAAKQESPGASARTWVVGVRFHVPATPTTEDWEICVIHGLFGGTNPTDVISLGCQDGTDIVVTRANPGAFTIATATSVVTPGAWHYIEFMFKIAESADGGSITVNLDGSEIIAATAADTNNALTTAFSHLRFKTLASNTGTFFVAYDDIYIMDTSVSPHTSFLGPTRVRSIPPNSDVTANWDSDPTGGTNVERIDENGADASDNVSTDVDATRDRYGVTNPSDSAAIMAVKFEAEVINQTGGSPSVHLEVVSGTSVETTEHVVTSTTAYDVFDMIVQDDPAGGAWTNADIDALQVGYLFKNNVV